MIKAKQRFSRLLTLFVFTSTLLLPTMTHAKKIYGLHENATLVEWNNAPIEAKLDTGAVTSSLNAVNIKFFDRDGEEWVRFQPKINDNLLQTTEKKVVRYSKIKSRTNSSDEENKTLRPSDKRAVVLIDICFDGTIYPLEVNLTDRSHFSYPLLIGSSSLIEIQGIVDPELEFQTNKQCE